MAREFSRRERVGDYLQRELASLIQRELRDPRLGHGECDRRGRKP